MESEPTSGVWREIHADLGASGRAFITSFASRDLGPLQLAYIPFNLTEWGAFIALLVFAYQIGGTGAVGLVALGQQIPAAVVASFGSVLADRFDRRRVLIGVLLLLAVMTTLAGAAMLLDAPSWLAVLLGCAAGWALTLVRPTYSALLPWVVHSPKELTQSYAASGLIESMCIFLGPLVTGLTLGIGTAAGVSGRWARVRHVRGAVVAGHARGDLHPHLQRARGGR